MRGALLAAIVAIASGCSLPPTPPASPAPTAWGDSVPEAAPDVVAAQPVVTTGPGTVTVLPISPMGAAVGKSYAYDMPQCAIVGPVDVDGSFWDAVGLPPDTVDFGGTKGTFRLVSRSEATFSTSDGTIIRLIRHAGAKEFQLCE